MMTNDNTDNKVQRIKSVKKNKVEDTYTTINQTAQELTVARGK